MGIGNNPLSDALKKLLEGLLEKNTRFRIDTGDELFQKWFDDKSMENINQKKYSNKKVKKNKTMEVDMLDLDYLNKYYGQERYSKYYEDENERKMILSSSSIKVENNYLSQTKSTSSKIKPKIFYFKNNYIDFLKKNSFKILLRKKNFQSFINHEGKKNENEKYIISSRNNQILLPQINNNFKSSNFQIHNIKIKRMNSHQNQMKNSKELPIVFK